MIAFDGIKSGNYTIELIDMTGRSVFTTSKNLLSGADNSTINVSSYAKGIYLLRLKSDQGTAVKKIVVQ